MLEYAKHEFPLGKLQKDGASLRQHLEVIERQTGKTPLELVPVELPESVVYLWSWFCDLSNGRGWYEGGPLPLTYTEIVAWSALVKTEPMAWEVRLLKEIDREFIKEAQKKNG